MALGPALQVAHGLLFAVVLCVFLDEPAGWLKLWGLFPRLAILGTTGPAPGSLAGRRPGRGWIVMYGLWALTILMSLAGALLPRAAQGTFGVS